MAEETIKQIQIIKIELKPEDAELFLWFRKYQSVWEKARTLRPGNLVCHFDKNNEMGKREFHYYGDKNEDKNFNPLTGILKDL